MDISTEDFISFPKFINMIGNGATYLKKETFKKYIDHYIDELYILQERGLIGKDHQY